MRFSTEEYERIRKEAEETGYRHGFWEAEGYYGIPLRQRWSDVHGGYPTEANVAAARLARKMARLEIEKHLREDSNDEAPEA